MITIWDGVAEIHVCLRVCTICLYVYVCVTHVYNSVSSCEYLLAIVCTCKFMHVRVYVFVCTCACE